MTRSQLVSKRNKSTALLQKLTVAKLSPQVALVLERMLLNKLGLEQEQELEQKELEPRQEQQEQGQEQKEPGQERELEQVQGLELEQQVVQLARLRAMQIKLPPILKSKLSKPHSAKRQSKSRRSNLN